MMNILEMYRELHKWDDAISVAEAKVPHLSICMSVCPSIHSFMKLRQQTFFIRDYFMNLTNWDDGIYEFIAS